MKNLDLKSKNIISENIQKISNVFPNVIVETSQGMGVDFDLLKQELSKDIVEGQQERYRLTWPGKRNSIFAANINTTNTLKPNTNKSIDFENTKNLYIEGDNLEVLKVLQESYLNKIKFIYIDPPYNTGNDFIYNDKFIKESEEELKDSGQIDEFGGRLKTNTDTGGRYHSNWLSMMYPRLKLARNLLANNGVIFVSIDDNEIHNLRKICDEIFGESNFVNVFCWLNNLKGRQISKNGAVKTYESILCYSKDISKINEFKADVNKLKEIMPSSYRGLNYDIKKDLIGEYVIKNELYNTNSIFNEETRPNLVFNIHYNPENKDIKFSEIDEDKEFENYFKILPQKNNNGIHKHHAWRWSKKKIINEFDDLEFVESDEGYKIYTKIRDFKNTNIKDIITDLTNGNRDIEKLFGKRQLFSFPKPIGLIKLLLFGLDKDSIVLDFFSGSATTAHAVMQLNAEDGGNRKYIMVQLNEKTDEKSEAYKAGYKDICEIGQERIRRAAKKIKEETGAEIDYGFRVYELTSSVMNDVYYSPDKVDQLQLSEFESNVKEDRTPEDILTHVMLDLGLTLDLKIEEREISGKKVFYVAGNSLVACFDKSISMEVVEEMCKDKPLKIVFNEVCFASDQEKINVRERIKRLSPETEVGVI